MRYTLDRTAFRAQTVEEASKHQHYYKKLTWQERLSITFYLNSVAFRFDVNNPPRMNKKAFSVRSHIHHG